MSRKAPRCDACGKRIRVNHHELILSDFETDQIVGRYYAPRCQRAAAKYIQGGAVLRLTYAHPTHCGPDQKLCDGGVFEVIA